MNFYWLLFLLHILQMEASSIKITNVFAYFSLATGELLLLCYYAEQLKRHVRFHVYTYVVRALKKII